jgi:hypothetical protein
MSDNLKHLYGIDATYTTNTTEHDASLEEAQGLVVELVEEPVNEAMSGTLWLFPTAVSGRGVTVRVQYAENAPIAPLRFDIALAFKTSICSRC